MSGSAPFFSVVVPARNAARTVAAAMESLARQSFADFEIVLVDDGSTDGTGAAAAAAWEAAGAPAPLRVLANPGSGIVDGLNAGAAAARSAGWIARFDADDLAEPRRLEQQAAAARRAPEAAAIGMQYAYLRPDGARGGDSALPLEPEAVLASLRRGFAPLCHPAMAIRRGAFEQAGGYRRPFTVAQDIDLWLRLGRIGPLMNLAERGVLYRGRARPGAQGGPDRAALAKDLKRFFLHAAALHSDIEVRAGRPDPLAGRETPFAFAQSEDLGAVAHPEMVALYADIRLALSRIAQPGPADPAAAARLTSLVLNTIRPMNKGLARDLAAALTTGADPAERAALAPLSALADARKSGFYAKARSKILGALTRASAPGGADLIARLGR